MYDTDVSQVCLPQGLQRIEAQALSNCMRLKEINLPEGLQYIGERAFEWTGITELVVPESVESVGPGMLEKCEVRHLTILGSKTKVAKVCEKEDLQPDAMLTADALEIRDYPRPFTAVHGLRSVVARWTAGEKVPDAVLERFRKYLRVHYREHWDDPKTFALIVALNVLPLKAMETAMQKATELKDPAITAALLQYQHEAFSREQIEARWQKKLEKS